jgi:ATP-dependent protease ClpP protease subunit
MRYPMQAVLLIVGTCLIVALPAPAIAEVTIDKTKVLVLYGPISGTNLEPLSTEILKRVDAGVRDIQLVIDSPGGEIGTGQLFISVMEEAKGRGMHIQCFVPRIAASMAFQILLHCSSRVALVRSFLLWHRARMYLSGASTASDLIPAVLHLQETDAYILRELSGVLSKDMDQETIEYHFNQETLHMGASIAESLPSFAAVYEFIPGLLSTLKDEKLPRSGTNSRRGPRNKGPMYIYEQGMEAYHQ